MKLRIITNGKKFAVERRGWFGRWRLDGEVKTSFVMCCTFIKVLYFDTREDATDWIEAQYGLRAEVVPSPWRVC